MKKTLGLTLTVALAVAVSGCGKKMNQFKSDYFTTNPNPLEVVGTQIPATVTGNVPAKFFVKNATVTVTPVLVYGNYQTAGAPVAFQGEKVRGNNTVVSYDRGGNVTIPVSFIYMPEMQKSELFLDFSVTQGNKQYVLPRVKVADGVIATAALATAATVEPAIAPDAFQRIINEKYSADIRFLINQANIRPGELKTSQMEAFNKDLAAVHADTSRVIEGIDVSSYASPDGSYSFNEELAQRREQNTTKYVEGRLKKDKITEFGELTASFTPEDWEGFQKLVAASNIQDKELILSVLSMYKDPEQREREIRNLSNVFDHSRRRDPPPAPLLTHHSIVNVIGKSDAEINALFNSDPAKLSVDELLYAATLTDDLNRQKAIYTACTKLYPNDFRGYNNLGVVLYEQGDFEGAKANFAKAEKISPRAAEVQMNEGLIALLKQDYSAAKSNFGNAGGLKELGDALGVYYLKQGDAAAAVKAFGASKTNNAALAQILTRTTARLRTLSQLSTLPMPPLTTSWQFSVHAPTTRRWLLHRSARL